MGLLDNKISTITVGTVWILLRAAVVAAFAALQTAGLRRAAR